MYNIVRLLTANPFKSTFKPKKAARKNNTQALAQMVERSTVVENKHRPVTGSNPVSLIQISLEKFLGRVVK